MFGEVSPADPGFIPCRDALVSLLRVAPSSAAGFLLRLRATQFEALRIAFEQGGDDTLRALGMRIVLAEIMAGDALDIAKKVRLDLLDGTDLDLVDTAAALALAASANTEAARGLLALARAAAEAKAAAAAEEPPATEPTNESEPPANGPGDVAEPTTEPTPPAAA